MGAIESVRDAVGDEAVEALRAAIGELSARTFELTEALYAELGGEGEGEGDEG